MPGIFRAQGISNCLQTLRRNSKHLCKSSSASTALKVFSTFSNQLS